MRVLLDTHILLWALSSPAKLKAEAKRIIEQADVYVSAASLWEISIKSALGKLDADSRDILNAIEPAGFLMLPITCEHAVRVAMLPLLHHDPFDRILVAQAASEPMILLTNDTALHGYRPMVQVV